MSNLPSNRKSANERSIEELQMDTLQWDKLLQISTEEIHFLEQYLSADIFQSEIPNIYESLGRFSEELEDIKIEKMELHSALRNHKNDLNGMRECEDISCDIFYHSQHQNISNSIRAHLSKFQELKLRIYRFSSPTLKKKSHYEDMS